MTKNEQQATPLFQAVIDYAKEQKVSFHTPGHKHGVSVPQEFRNFVGEHIFDCDLTLLEEVDSLHEPQGVIKEAQILAAKAYQTDAAFFLVNGTSGGNHAMILTACEPGDKIIIPRNAHRSVQAGILLSGATPIYVMPECDESRQQLLNITPESVEVAIKQHPDAKAVLVTSPTYQGICADITKIASIVHQAGMLLLVDEAHGPHLHFHPDLPEDAMRCGADMCVQSSHKIISSLTQASLLLAKNTVDITKLRTVLMLLMTTSPSYILMASLDLARMQMATRGRALLDTTIALASETRDQINAMDGLYCFGKEILNNSSAFDQDVTKLVVNVRALGWSGYETAHYLNQKNKIQVEFADGDTVLLIVSVGNTYKDVSKLVDALQSMVNERERQQGRPIEPLRFPVHHPEVVLPPRKAVFAPSKIIPLDQAEGEISAETFSPYPPGIPLINPGEKVTKEMIRYLKKLHDQGGRIQGQSDAELKTIKVVETVTIKDSLERVHSVI